MSKANDIGSDRFNLCTTEDAFDKFQSVSMYDEDEYITIDDIVPLQPPNPDISEILRNMSNNDASPLLIEETLNQVTSTTDQTVKGTTKKKRGSKKNQEQKKSGSSRVSEPGDLNKCSLITDYENKNSITSQGLELSCNDSRSNGEQALLETPNCPSLEPSKIGKCGRYPRNKKPVQKTTSPQQTRPPQQKIPKKRGRPAKPKIIEVPTSSINENTISHISTNSGNKVSNINEVLVKNTETRISQRKKRIPSELIEFSNEIVIETDTDFILASPEEGTISSENLVSKHKKRRIIKTKNSEGSLNLDQHLELKNNKQQKSNELTEDEMEDMPLLVLSNKMATFEKSEADIQLSNESELLIEKPQPSDTTDTIAVQKTPKKHGRCKKKDSNNCTQIQLSDDDNNQGLHSSKKCIIDSEEIRYNFEKNIEHDKSVQNDSLNKRNSKKPIMSDFEYNIDSIVKSNNQDVHQLSEHSESDTRDSSKRPVRRKAKKNFHYDEGSDEDPYANVELSDDEPRKGKGGRYYSDDEYIPGGQQQLSDMSDSENDFDIDEGSNDDLFRDSIKQKGRNPKKLEAGSSRKRVNKKDGNHSNNLDVITQKPLTDISDGDDLEALLETSIIKTSEDSVTPKAWGSSQEFKDFLFKISQGSDIKIKKAKSIDSTKTPLQIPVINPNEAKKTAEMCAQTDIIKSKAVSVQTNNVNYMPMKNQVTFAPDLSQRACQFLSNIVKDTAELGQLMTQKSEYFIEKKINTTYVTDTYKMDYCVKKSFLLFKLAKDNLVQMEDNLVKQYEEFLNENNLIQHREAQKIIESTSKDTNSDSDCEIVETPEVKKKAEKPGFNPKTVFLNKELSIKIAKKNTEEPKPKTNFKKVARQTVWINDAIMVKKVKPTQSFLAQDSRNKKPPDTYVTLEMISNFFAIYNRQIAISTCAQFVRPEWFTIKPSYNCYFFEKTCETYKSTNTNNEELPTESPVTENNLLIQNDTSALNIVCPNSLSSLCTAVMHKMMSMEDNVINKKIYSIAENVKTQFDSSKLVNNCKDERQGATHLGVSNRNDLCIMNKNHQSVKSMCLSPLNKTCPNSLSSFCTEVINKVLCVENIVINKEILCFMTEHDKPQFDFSKLVNNGKDEIQVATHLGVSNRNGICVLNKNQQSVKSMCLRPLNKASPNSLLSLCTEVIKIMLCVEGIVINKEILCCMTENVKPQFESSELVNFCKDDIQLATNLGVLNGNGICILNKNLNKACPNSLLSLCSEVIQKKLHAENIVKPQLYYCTLMNNCKDETQDVTHLSDLNINSICVLNKNQQPVKIMSLKTLCYIQVTQLLHKPDINEITNIKRLLNHSEKNTSFCEIVEDTFTVNHEYCLAETVKSLFSLCIKVLKECHDTLETKNRIAQNNRFMEPDSLQHIIFNKVKNMLSQRQCSIKNFVNKLNIEISVDVQQTMPKRNSWNYEKPCSLKSLCFEAVKKSFKSYGHSEKNKIESQIGIDSLDFTINDINTVSADVFFNGACEEYSDNNRVESNNFDDDEHNYSNECVTNYDNNVEEDDSNWVSLVQMKELRSFVELTQSNNNDGPPLVADLPPNGIVDIKTEPLDEPLENIVESIVKSELLDEEDTTFMPLPVTKQETADASTSSIEPNGRQNSKSYDENVFENFVSSNKMIMALDSNVTTSEEVFTQSTLRIRRQYEPDSDGEVENFADSLNLLVPQNVETAKDRLMESSSDEDTNKKKKPEKRSRGRSRRNAKTLHPCNNAPQVKEILTSKSPLAVLTRKMREKIRQVEKHSESSESESEDTLSVIKETLKDKPSKKQSNDNKVSEASTLSVIQEKVKDKSPKKAPSNDQVTEDVIQCNDVDSTEQINDNKCTELVSETAGSYEEEHNQHDEDSQLADANDRSISPLINADEPVELLECEPNISMFENLMVKPHINRKLGSKTDILTPAAEKTKKYSSNIDYHGWDCYPIDRKDGKIYQPAQIILDKLPESFVETYLKYQHLSECSKDDSEVDKLTNLHSLHRVQSKEKGRPKVKFSKTTRAEPGKMKSSEAETVVQTEVKTEQCDELSPSEDEGENTEEIPLALSSERSAENCLAKDFLMNDEEDSGSEKHNGEGKKSDKLPNKSDNLDEISLKKHFDEISPKKHLDETSPKKHLDETSPKKPRRPSQGKGVEDKVKPKNLMLTADKMMTKELAMLHAPVDLDLKQEVQDIKDVSMKTVTRSAHKTSPKINTTREHNDNDDDSSSEEEKQWFTTKEKLLKRLEKKQECPSVDDAKRAKIVSEFIEKRSDGPTVRLRGRPTRRRSLKKLMERRKQMKILTRELLGDDSTHTGKKSYQTYAKGRRNIRKVINKKALSHSTVMANMEEFERKQRLNMRQTQLRQILGCEEGVNVVVINDELCLQYDFVELRPVVTVHPFFTKVMKAHQYEGVKFMWDACFESVARVQSGHAGSGCILAHCMGLGKTLQVLALLHTVLTHPQVGMQRVLVCCPLSTVLNWVDEIHKWIGPVTGQIKVFELSKLRKTYERAYQLEDWYSGGGIFIIGYELFRSLSTIDPVLDCVRVTIVNKIRTALLDPGPDIIICDEGHLLKNDCSVLAVAMSRVQTRRRIILTGTPMQNNLREYYCMVNFVKPNLLGSYSEYSNRFENPIMNGQHRDSIEEDIKLMKARTHILHKVLEGCLQRQEASVLYPYLPKKYEYTVFVSLTKSQRELYTHYLNNYAKETKQSVLKDFHVLQKIWTHPQVLHNFFMKNRDEEKQQKIKVEKEDDLVAEDLGASEDSKPNTMETWWLPHVAESDVLDALHSSNKFLVIFRLLDECIALGDKVLIFSTSLYTLDALEYFLRRINNWSLGREYYRLDGSVPAEVRQKWCREFNAETNTGTKLFLISTRAGSLGLNMTSANRVIILDTSWNPAHDIQSIFRVYRFGQKKDCYIYRLVAMGTMEQKIYERSVTKQAVACRVVDEQQIDRHYNMSELTELYRLDEDGSGVSAGLAAGIRDAALLRVASSDTPSGPLLHAVHEHDSLLRGSSETGLPEDERAAVWSQFQEEHATKHIQSIAMNLPKEEFNSNDTPNTENIQQGATNQPTAGASDAKPKKRRKKAAANKNTPQPSTSSQEEPHPNPEIEELTVRKIMDILIQHNFHTTHGPQEIANLIRNVRKTVANPNKGFRNVDPMVASIAKVLIQDGVGNSLQPTDTNTGQRQSSIALTDAVETIVGTPADYNSMLCADQTDGQGETDYSGRKRRGKGQVANLNREENIIGETDSTETIVGTPFDNSIYYQDTTETQDSQDSDPEIPERKKRRQRRQSDDEEYVPEKRVMKKLTIANIPTTRKSNEHNLAVESNAVSITSDSEECYLTQPLEKKLFTKKANIKTKKTSTNKNVTDDIRYDKWRQQINEKLSNKQPLNVESEPCDTGESILLSDDDEPVEIISLEKPDMIPKVDIKSEKQLIRNTKRDDDPPIPLHKTLLTNKNFIKIVAHTYLSGNPMLDEDAAILAAQYSMLKALKELEATKKDITSGPIYDIAMQVLGIDLLKKLYYANKKGDETLQLDTGISPNETLTKTPSDKKVVNIYDEAPQEEMKKKLGPRGKSLRVNSVEAGRSSATTTYDVIEMTSTSASVPATTTRPTPRRVTSPDVVPVEMFQGPGPPSMQSRFPSQDECILPDDDDDDDDLIVGHSRNCQPNILNSVSRATIKASVTRPKVVHIVRKQAIVNPIPLPPPPANANSNASNLSDIRPVGTPFRSPASGTICLDSDDEDAPLAPVATTRRAVKSTTKLPHPALAASTDAAVGASSHSRLKATLEKKKKIVVAPAADCATNASPHFLYVPSQSIRTARPDAPTETIIPEEIISDDVSLPAVQQVKKKCRPGDIIQINKSGKLIILRKTEKPPSFVVKGNRRASPSSTCAKIAPGELTKVSEPQINKLGAGNARTPAGDPSRTLLNTAETNQTPTAPEPSYKQSTSNADSSRCKSPDPLSVLKNVVHIPADQYQRMSRKESYAAPATANDSVDNDIITAKMCANRAIKKAEALMQSVESRPCMKGGKDGGKMGDPSNKVIDLTEVSAAAKAEESAPTKKYINFKLSGTSKDISINKAGSLVSNVNDEPSTTVKLATKLLSHMKKRHPATSQKTPATEVGKRSSPWQGTPPCKKKKPEGRKMTLADFNIDDLDDIIELE